MTNHVRGSSLLQARDNHRRLHTTNNNNNHIRSPGQKKLQKRDHVVVQTISVIHVIDETGAVIETILPQPATKIPDQPAALTAGLPAANNVLPSVIPSTDNALPEGDAALPAGSALPSDPLSLLAGEGSLTSSLSPSPSAFSSLSGGYNSTHFSSLFHNSTALYSNSTRSSFSSSAYPTSSYPSLTSIFVVPTDGADGAGRNVDANGVPGFVPTTTPVAPAPFQGPGLPPAAQSAVIGGVVGGVAGIALIAMALMFLLKWRRGHPRGLMLLGDGDSTSSGKGLSSDPGGYKPGGGPMAERMIPFAVPSALASLTGNKRALEDGPRQSVVAEERGFRRVSGRKLISVLQSGGDGYSDPHASVMSGTSDYRNSEAFLGGSALPRLQLGSPMRPESGVMVMRSGPNRTPVQAQVPFSDPFADQPTPNPVTPPIQINGRSLTSRVDLGPAAWASRFAETM